MRRIVGREGDGLAALAAVPADHPLVEDGGAPSAIALEMAAQAAAALAALEGGGQEEPRQGYLVGVRNAAFDRPVVAAGEELRVTVTPAGSAPPLAVHDFTVHSGETLVARGTISTYSLLR